MSKINYRRKKEGDWKYRIPIPKPDRIIEPDTVYVRDKQKRVWKNKIKEYLH